MSERLWETLRFPSFFPDNYCVALREKRMAGNESLKTGEEPAHTLFEHS